MDETDWQRQLLVGLLALAVVAALVGGIGGFLSLRAAELAGITPAAETTSTDPTDPSPEPRAPRPEPTRPPESTQPRPTDPRSPSPTPERAYTLTASPESVAAYERINLVGTYEGTGAPTTVQVQRLEGKTWVDFPVTASVVDGRFATYILTGVVGLNRFRVQDTSGQTSNVVSVAIG